MTSKFTHIEWTRDGNTYTEPVVRASCLAVLCVDQNGNHYSRNNSGAGAKNPCGGLNLCIAFYHETAEEYGKFKARILPSILDSFDLYLHGKDGSRIPIWCAEGNGWREESKTSCIFAYLSPKYFDNHDSTYPVIEDVNAK